MIDIFKKCSAIEAVLRGLVGSSIIIDFRIVLRTNENLYAYLLVSEADEIVLEKAEAAINPITSNIEIELITNDDQKNEQFYKEIFAFKERINIEKGRRRFDSLLDHKSSEINETLPTVATFYSYKGGMGRSTTLAAMAIHLALVDSKNVVIIDCDFEAPGFTNFFLKNAGEENQQQGFVEYLLDKETGAALPSDLNKYSWQVDSKYVGTGNIRIMPAGNLDSSTATEDFLRFHLNHYIEGLSRIDFANENYIVNLFKSLLLDLKSEYQPDIILIDARTGFSDVLGIAAFQLSKFVVGFFRNDAQSRPGLSFFLQRMVELSYVEPFLINSILPSSPTLKRKMFADFKEQVETIIEKLDNDTTLNFLSFPISRNENLELIGTANEEPDDLIELIRSKQIIEFKEIFEHFSTRLKFTPTGSLISIAGINTENGVLESQVSTNESTSSQKSPMLPDDSAIMNAIPAQKIEWQREIKEYIIVTTLAKINATSLYADEHSFSVEDEYNNGRFFYRTCMNDLFNNDKPIILGSKGTGKSYIHKALKSSAIVEYLKGIAGKNDHFNFIAAVDKNEHIVRIAGSINHPQKQQAKNFWLIYTWQLILSKIKYCYPKYLLSIKKPVEISLKDDNTTLAHFKKLMIDNNYLLEIENELERFDDYLVATGNGIKNFVVVLFDQLDEIIYPEYWDDWIPSLIEFWSFKHYKRIFGKLFLRKDLFRRLSGVNNINHLENRAIDIEWTQAEIFSYFFKLVFSEGGDQFFWVIFKLYGEYDSVFIEGQAKQYKKLSQMPLKDYLLEPLVATYFGKYIDVNSTTRMGGSYDWFFKNLCNADDTISLRPFIDLIKLAIESRAKNRRGREPLQPILYQLYYTDKDVRKEAVNRHVNDLIRTEKGTKPIEYVFNFFDNCEIKYRFVTLPKKLFEEVLNAVIEKNASDKSEMQHQNVSSLETLLITNGIVKKVNHGKGDEYRFAFLYKYRLGLKGN